MKKLKLLAYIKAKAQIISAVTTFCSVLVEDLPPSQQWFNHFGTFSWVKPILSNADEVSCLGHNIVPKVRFEPATLWSRVLHSTNWVNVALSWSAPLFSVKYIQLEGQMSNKYEQIYELNSDDNDESSPQKERVWHGTELTTAWFSVTNHESTV